MQFVTWQLLAQGDPSDKLYSGIDMVTVADMFRCHAPPLWVLVVLMIGWTAGIQHRVDSQMQVVQASLEVQCVSSFYCVSVISGKDNDFTESFAGCAEYSKAMWNVSWIYIGAVCSRCSCDL